MSVHTYLDSFENWKLFFLRLRHSSTKNAGFRKTVHRVEFFLANVGLLETLVSLRNGTAGRRGCKMLVCDKRGRAITYVFCHDLQFKGKWSLAKSYLKTKLLLRLSHKGCGLLTSPVLLRKFSLKIRGRRRQVKRRFKSEFAVFQSSSRLFHLACFVECMRPLLELNS